MTVNLSPKIERLLIHVQQEYGIELFIETGTNYGETAEWASNVFEQVITIELSGRIYETALQKRGGIHNIEFIHGNSVDELAAIAPTLESPTIVYLDAHCGLKWLETESSEVIDQTDVPECPVLDEIQAIGGSDHLPLLVIDDASVFTSPRMEPFDAGEWPDIQEIIHALESISDEYRVIIYEDTILAVPPELVSTVRKTIRAQKTAEYRETADKSRIQRILLTFWLSVVRPAASKIYQRLG